MGKQRQKKGRSITELPLARPIKKEWGPDERLIFLLGKGKGNLESPAMKERPSWCRRVGPRFRPTKKPAGTISDTSVLRGKKTNLLAGNMAQSTNA